MAFVREHLLQNLTATGYLQQENRRLRFAIQAGKDELTVRLPDHGREFRVSTRGNLEVTETSLPAPRKLSTAELESDLGETGLGIDDLCFRFLFWGNHTDGAGVRIRGVDCVGVRFFPPEAGSRYSSFTVWIDPKSKMPYRASGDMKDGTSGKQFDVIAVQRSKEEWFLRRIRISRRTKRISYIEFDSSADASVRVKPAK